MGRSGRVTGHNYMSLDRNANLLCIDIFISDHPFKALIDSGSSHSYVSHEMLGVLLQVDVDIQLYPSELDSLKIANGGSMKIIGKVYLELKTSQGADPFVFPFHVVRDLAHPIFVGINLLTQRGAYIDFRTRQVAFTEGTYVRNSEPIVIPAHSQIKFRVKADNPRVLGPCSLLQEAPSFVINGVKGGPGRGDAVTI